MIETIKPLTIVGKYCLWYRSVFSYSSWASRWCSTVRVSRRLTSTKRPSLILMWGKGNRSSTCLRSAKSPGNKKLRRVHLQQKLVVTRARVSLLQNRNHKQRCNARRPHSNKSYSSRCSRKCAKNNNRWRCNLNKCKCNSSHRLSNNSKFRRRRTCRLMYNKLLNNNWRPMRPIH